MGKVIFTLKTAANISEEDGIGKNDLYAKITYGGQSTKSEVANDGALPLGYKYSWNQTFEFDLTNDDDIEVKLYDQDVGLDDFIGQAKFKLGKAKANGTSEEKENVVNKSHEVKGHILAAIEVQH